MFFSDPNLRRFFAEIYSESNNLHFMVELFHLHQRFANIEKTETELYLLSATVIGQDQLILRMLDEEPERFTLDQICDHCLSTMFMLISLEPESALQAKESGAALFRQIRDKLDMEYFREFRYVRPENGETA